MANKILTEERKQQILSRGVKDMPQNPASQGYTKDQIRAFYYIPEEMIIDDMTKIEAQCIADNEALTESVNGALNSIDDIVNFQEIIVSDMNNLNERTKTLEEKTKILKVDQTKPNRFLSEDGTYKEIKECDCKPIVVDKELNESSTNVVENQAIAKAIKGKQDKLTAGENIKIENGVISAEGGSGGTNIEANPEEEATEDLSKLKVGDTVYDVPKNLYGEGTPTTVIIGKQGQKYIDTKTDKVYIYIDNAWVNLISGNTIKGSNGFLFSENILKLNSAYKSNIDGEYDNGTKDDNYLYYRPLPITILNYKYAVKRALTNPEDFNDSNQTRFIKNIWTDEERAKARETLGITSSGGSGGGGTKLYKHTFTIEGWDTEMDMVMINIWGYFYSPCSDIMIFQGDYTLYTEPYNISTIIGGINIFDMSDPKQMHILPEEHYVYDLDTSYEWRNLNEVVTEV